MVTKFKYILPAYEDPDDEEEHLTDLSFQELVMLEQVYQLKRIADALEGGLDVDVRK